MKGTNKDRRNYAGVLHYIIMSMTKNLYITKNITCNKLYRHSTNMETHT